MAQANESMAARRRRLVAGAAVIASHTTEVGAASADVEAADAQRFQRFILRNQYPADCSVRDGVLTRAGLQPDGAKHWSGDYFYGLGLGSQMASLKYNLVHALLHGRVYHFPTTHYVNPVRCASQTFDCYFAPPTNCSRVKRPADGPSMRRVTHRKVETAPLLWCFELPRRRLSRLAGLHGVHSEAWYQGQLAAFLFRPNDEMRAYRADAVRDLAFDTNHTRAATLSAAPGGLHNGSCAAMHVRRTDKFRGRRREDLRSQIGFHGFGRAFKFWAHWMSARPSGQVRVLLGSEDPLTFKSMPPLLWPAVSYWLPSRHFVMESFKDITDNNNRLVDRYAQIVRRMAAARASGDAAAVAALEARGARKDEGMALVLQILMMSECEALFGSYASNVAILVHDLMHARMVARRERLHAVDVNGRTYCGCGASFCMKLEKRAGREPKRTVRNMIEAFRGSNINAI